MTTSTAWCRSCGSTALEPVLSLGRMPLANALVAEGRLGQPEPLYPLDVVLCPQCALVQITEIVPREVLFSEYIYFSSYSETMLRHAREIADGLIESRRLGPSSLVIELASNDGYLLQNLVRQGIPVLGIEPAANIARVAEEKGVRTLCRFFDDGVAREVRDRGQTADVILANNVLAHVSDLKGFVEGIRILLKDDGVAVIEMPYVRDLIERREFDTIYHEHIYYFSATALQRLFGRHGLELVDVARLPIHGGSLRVTVARAGGPVKPSPRVRDILQEEQGWGVERLDYYRAFGQQVERIKAELLALLARLKGEGKRIAAYGAAAKGTVLLNYYGIRREVLEFVADRNPHKQGQYVPGVQVPICPASRLLETMPDYTLLLVWNLTNEILEQEAEYRRRGGRFIIPVPEVRVV